MSRKKSKEKAIEEMNKVGAAEVQTPQYRPPKNAKEAAKKNSSLGFHVRFEKKKLDGKHVVHASLREHEIADEKMPQEFSNMGEFKDHVGKKVDEYASAMDQDAGTSKEE